MTSDVKLPRAILFDLDDTILDYGGGVDEAWRVVCAMYAPAVPCDGPRLQQAIREYAEWHWSDPERHRAGRLDLRSARAHIVTEALRTLGHDQPELARQIAHDYSDARERTIGPFPDALNTLTTLRSRGVAMALVTNGAAGVQRAKIDRWSLGAYFPSIVIEGEFGVGKPDPRVYRFALGELGVSPGEAWMVGDNLDWDVAAPQQLGLRGIWNDFRRTGLPPDSAVRPDRIVLSIAELVKDVRHAPY